MLAVDWKKEIMVVIINFGHRVVEFGSDSVAGWEFAQQQARKGNHVWFVSRRTAVDCEFL